MLDDLSPEDLRRITRRRQHAAQARVLTAMGIVFKVHPITGHIMTTQTAVTDALLKSHQGKPATNDAAAPNWTKAA